MENRQHGEGIGEFVIQLCPLGVRNPVEANSGRIEVEMPFMRKVVHWR